MRKIKIETSDNCLIHTHKIPEKHLMSGKLSEEDLNLLDQYVNYIHKVIDESDYMFYKQSNYTNLLNKLNYEIYDEFILGNELRPNIKYIFDIRDEQSKLIVKNNLKFNLSDEDREPHDYNINKSYILKKLTKDWETISFIKDSKLIGTFCMYDGYFYDYRNIPNNPWIPVYEDERTFDNQEDYRYGIPTEYIKVKELINNEEKFNNYWNKTNELIDESSIVYIHSTKEMTNRIYPNPDYFNNLYINDELIEEKIISCPLWREHKELFLEEFKKILKEDNTFNEKITSKREKNKEYECYYFADRFEIITGIIYKYNGLLYSYESQLIKKKTK